MKVRAIQLFLAAVVILTLGGCEAIGLIFEAGVWVGVIVVVAVVAIIAFVVSRFRG
jgi:hypothetical protein